MKNTTNLNTIKESPSFVQADFSDENIISVIDEFTTKYAEYFIEAEVVHQLDTFFMLALSALSTNLGRNIIEKNLFFLNLQNISNMNLENKGFFSYKDFHSSANHFASLISTVFKNNYMLSCSRFYDIFSTSDFGIRFCQERDISKELFIHTYCEIADSFARINN